MGEKRAIVQADCFVAKGRNSMLKVQWTDNT